VQLHDLYSRYYSVREGAKRELGGLHNEELLDVPSRNFGVREGGGEWRRLGNYEMHDLHSMYCGLKEVDKRGLEKTA